MNVSLGERREGFVAGVVGEGRYASASEVVREGLRLVEEREARLQSLRDTLHAPIAGGGRFDNANINATLEDRAAHLSGSSDACGNLFASNLQNNT